MTTHHIVYNVPTKCHDFLYLVQRERKQSIATAIMYEEQINYQLMMLGMCPKAIKSFTTIVCGSYFLLKESHTQIHVDHFYNLSNDAIHQGLLFSSCNAYW